MVRPERKEESGLDKHGEIGETTGAFEDAETSEDTSCGLESTGNVGERDASVVIFVSCRIFCCSWDHNDKEGEVAWDKVCGKGCGSNATGTKGVAVSFQGSPIMSVVRRSLCCRSSSTSWFFSVIISASF